MTETCDVLVAGAGIHGAGVAQAAAAAGYSVVVAEMNSIAAATSSRSSKLIHGGLRYLEQMRLGLVRECLRERALLLRLAPELVRLERFFIPVYRDTDRRPWWIRTGLSLYAVLGGLRPGNRFRVLDRSEWRRLDGLRTENLQAVFAYQDGQTDDAALTRAVMRSACSLGARLVLPAELVHARVHRQGIHCALATAEGVRTVEAGVLINATGPWVNRVLNCIEPAVKKLPIDLVQGSHILLEHPLREGVYYLEAPSDRRAIFLMPWHGHTLIGTTERPFDGDPAAVCPSETEQRYLLQNAGHYFPELADNGRAGLVDSFAGLRVLPARAGRAFRRSREIILHTDRRVRPRVLSIYGGKLTSYRADALKVMRRVAASLPDRKARADTADLALSPDD
ncbi:MAG: FAD-dependent oxidoreductase [Gammaproteobacteria bacterium]|jgi:glycerol-3-phosphate dehydrogenase